LAIGFAGAEEVVGAWTNSKTHYANLIDPDFSEIGVGMVAGMYNNNETTLIAQYFAHPSYLIPQNDSAVDEDNASVALLTQQVALPRVKNLVADNVLATKRTMEEDEDDNEPPVIDYSQTKLEMNNPAGQDTVIVRFSTKLSDDTILAELSFDNYKINLQKEENNIWSGSAIIVDKKSFNTIVLANLLVKDYNENSAIYDIDWADAVPIKSSLAGQYFFLKSHPAKYIKSLFEISSLFFKIILALAVLALGLNVFIEIKKQHPKLIASSMALIALLVLLIVF